MKHFDENTLELFLLNSKLIENERHEIAKHLEECYSCNELFLEMREYHNAVSGEGSPIKLADDVSKKTTIVLKPAYSTVGKEINRKSIQISYPTKVWFYAANNPYKTAFFALSFACMVVFGLNVKSIMKDRNPDHIITNDSTKTIGVFNKENKLLWNVYSNQFDINKSNEDYFNLSFTEIADLDDDGTNEIVSTAHNLFNATDKLDYLTILNSDKTIRFEKKLGREVSFNTSMYDDNFETRGLLVDNFSGKGKEIIVGIKNLNSPYAILRLNNSGNVLGEYWHHGHFWGMHEMDLNNDGKKEILLCGRNDVVVGDEKAVICILDPSKIVGVTESNETRGFTFLPSKAELAYIEFTIPQINGLPKLNPRITELVSQNKDHFTVFLRIVEEKLPDSTMVYPGFDITLNKDLTIQDIKPIDATNALFEKLVKEGKISKGYLNTYIGEIKKRVVRVGR